MRCLSSLRDVEEGADILMVKPGLPYLDILKELSRARSRARGPCTRSAASTPPSKRWPHRGSMAGARGPRRVLDRVRARRRLDDHHLRRTSRARMAQGRMRTATSEALCSSARKRVSPGGVHSPVRAFRGVGGTPRFIREAAAPHDRRRRQRVHRLLHVFGPAASSATRIPMCAPRSTARSVAAGPTAPPKPTRSSSPS